VTIVSTHQPAEMILQPPTMLRKELVRDLSPRLLAELEAIRTRYHVSPGELLFSRGERASRVIEIATGTVKLWLDRPQQDTVLLRLVRPGELLGVREAVIGRGYGVNASAVSAVEYFTMPRKGLLDLMHKHFELGFNVTKLLSSELSSAHETLRGMVADAAPVVKDRRHSQA
jgi:CRP/FNR family transcriptional regulator, polysaccharide utilization system transcription regulator